MASKQALYELETFLQDVADKGFGVIYIAKLWRLLDKGSRAAGTWKALLDAWEELGHGFERSEIHICEVSHEYLVLTTHATEPIAQWAGEE
jgi:hypothetical protein